MEQNRSSNKQSALKAYAELVHKITPKSKLGQGCLRSFWVGGSICMLGQAISDLAASLLHLSSAAASACGSIFLIFLTALLTGLGFFDRIARYAGAGTVVPITGFANSVVSPAVEFKTEGFVPGVGTKMFVIAGPVIVYGVSAGVVYGLVLCLLR